MIVIVDSGVANFSSVVFALDRHNVKAKISRDKNEIKQASKVILPGVGTARAAMENFKKFDLIETIRQLQQPVLGFCLGMQLLYEHSAEGDVDCLGIVPGKIERFSGEKLIIPHMGWNTIQQKSDSPLFRDIDNGSYVYFVHSFKAPVNEATLAVCEYGEAFTAVCQFNNFFATQFHPERSGKVGHQLVKNFLELC